MQRDLDFSSCCSPGERVLRVSENMAKERIEKESHCAIHKLVNKTLCGCARLEPGRLGATRTGAPPLLRPPASPGRTELRCPGALVCHAGTGGKTRAGSVRLGAWRCQVHEWGQVCPGSVGYVRSQVRGGLAETRRPGGRRPGTSNPGDLTLLVRNCEDTVPVVMLQACHHLLAWSNCWSSSLRGI